MQDLTKANCVPCKAGTPPLTLEQANDYKTKINPAWELHRGHDIKRQFSFKDFKEAISFVNKVASLAESEGHHPDITISWNKVNLNLFTHAINGLSPNDFILAAKIDQIIF